MEEIVARYEADLLRYAARLVNSRVAAQDVVQNVFIKLFRQWDGVSKPSAKLRSWLFRVTHNEAVDHVRRESRLSLLHRKHAEEQELQSGGRGEHRQYAERRALVLEYLHRLHEREKQVVVLRLEHGMSYRQIAEITGRKESYVGNILHHAVQKLSLILQKEGAL
jgi:RNA polymerase sigma-70 factor (ECF subfamily)